MSVTVDIADGVATVTLDRPARRNAFTAGMGAALGEAYRRCDGDDAVRAVVLTGAPPAFCAGADLAEGDRTFAGAAADFSAAGVSMPAFAVRKPVIAAVNGHAVGIGLTLALQCDIRFMAADATYGVVQVRLGGTCSSCPSTVRAVIVGIEDELRRRVPGVEYLEAVP